MLKLSLIVPTYGVEKYINKFLYSLEPNLQLGIEVLIINDGTKDRSAEIAEKFALKHPNYVKVIHKKNGGVSSARNKGLELAKGEYVVFPDPDDFLDENYVSTILNTINEYNTPDMIFFDYFIGSTEIGFKHHTVSCFKDGFIQKENFIREFVKDSDIKGMLWCKAIKKTFYDGLLFNTSTYIAEDYELLTPLVLKLEKIVYISKPLYYYVTRENSLTHTTSLIDTQKFYNLVLERQLIYSKLFNELSTRALTKASLSVLSKAYQQSAEIKFDKYEKTVCKNIKSIIEDNTFSLNEKKKCLLIYLGIAKFYYRLKYKNKTCF